MILDDTRFLQIVVDVIDLVAAIRPSSGQSALVGYQAVVVELPQVLESQKVYTPTLPRIEKMISRSWFGAKTKAINIS